MNGAGNDFVVVDNRRLELSLAKDQIARLCDRHRGVGADGLLAAEPPQGQADFRMRYYNADGGEAEMCGNGARCFARFAARLMPALPAALSFETQAGLVRATFSGDLVTVNMNAPRDVRAPKALDLDGSLWETRFINTGVPHAVAFVDDAGAVDIARYGAALRWHAEFAPKGANANFAQVVSPGNLLLRTFERGVEGETLACGTGVCAAALLHHLAAGAPSPIAVRVKGGDTLMVGFEKAGAGAFKNVTLTGPADFVFEGETSI